jgi:Rrf2 family protein
MFSQTTEYALRAAVWLAGGDGAPFTTQQIADATHVPANYLSKIMQALGRAGVVHAQRGKHGGFTLTKRAEDTTVLDIVDAVDPIRRIDRCPLGLAAHQDGLCALHRRMDAAIASIERSFGATTLAELRDEPASEAAHA